MGLDIAVHMKLMYLYDNEDIRLTRGYIKLRKNWEIRPYKLVVMDCRCLVNQAKLEFGMEETFWMILNRTMT